MDTRAVNTFVELLEKLACGDLTASDQLRQLNFSLDHGCCLYNLYEQWRGAFSYVPGRKAALQPILDLARKVRSFSRDDTHKMYQQPEWKLLVAMRGPVDVVQIYRCTRCRREYPAMGMSGFLDMDALACENCGSVCFKSIYDPHVTCECSCGHPFPTKGGCPSCGNRDGEVVRELSPYQYFEDHQYTDHS